MTRPGRTIAELGQRMDLRGLARRPLPLVLVALAVVELVRLVLAPSAVDALLVVVLAGAGVATARRTETDLAADRPRPSEAESFARILRGLSRSVSPDAIVAAIVEEVGAGTGADHVAVVRRRPDAHLLEAILSATRAGAPASRTTFPLTELEDPAADDLHAARVGASRGRPMAAVPIEPDPAGDPDLVPLGIAADRLVRRSGLEITGSRVAATAATAARPAVATPGLARGGRRAGAGGSGTSAQATPVDEGAAQRIADRLGARLRDAYGLSHPLAAPLRIDGRVEGAIVVSRRRSRPWAASAPRILEGAAVEASAALARVYSLRDAEARATTDALTGLPNRRYFDEYVALLSQRRRAEDRVGVLMIDIDRFKTLNDTFGHGVGDHVLRDVAQAIAGAVRENDVPARFGGEEFAVLLKNPSLDVAVEVGERVRRAVGSLDLAKIGVPGVSVSVGVAVAPSPDAPLEGVIDLADAALYRAKRAGRDRVVAA